ncbi:hypothetical protein D9619_008518 [Psilocybe cf. subviscida]|uniref:Zinc/iron permease n=1 Tax=Psilocybe cf. subviscida TaxID=2480587 RepID=A0A8H5F0I3_9AGAR|nr:hypothetical protein D9619_008518 [Psilocybe cf. subviscida]
MTTPTPTRIEPGDEATKLSVLGIILVVSLFAVSFPGLSKRTPFLRIPEWLFFIGKHFGTGVILATAFIHLLSDAFSSLQNEEVKQKYGPVGRWTGGIILGSLLVIFLVEYISTLYVEHLNDRPSAPSTPTESREGSVPPGHRLSVISIDEETPLLVAQSDAHHHRHPSALPAMSLNGVPVELLAGSPRVCRLSIAHIAHQHHEAHQPPADEEDYTHAIGRKRQVIGILVLQLGIMVHSLVIGMTLVVTSGADFTSLATAISFHQLFEGLSLGIRIAALPPPKESQDNGEDAFDALPRSESYSGNLSPRGSSRPQKWSSPVMTLRRCVSHYTARLRRLHWLKPTLAILFGLTTPAGMILGMLIWGGSRKPAEGDAAQMRLVQGIMSAVSAGLLIYASTVEMLAGDFVYGDVDGGHGHHHHSHEEDRDHFHDEHAKGGLHRHDDSHEHGHEHDHRQEQRHSHSHRRSRHASRTGSTPHAHAHRLSKLFSAENETTSPSHLPPPADCSARTVTLSIADADALAEPRRGVDLGMVHETEAVPEHPPKASLRKRLLALASLFAGAIMMVLVGLGE